VPYNISAIGGAALRESGAVSINDLTRNIVGLLGVDEGPANRTGTSNLTLRGLRTETPGGGAEGPIYPGVIVSPVSTYFGETPVFFQMPLFDVERVEVLRGPQGTLYGSGSQAGTIRLIPNRPQFGEFSGEVDANGSLTEHAPNANGSIHGILNIPIADHLALRVVAGEDHLAGFVKAVDRWKLGADGVPVPSIPGDLTSGPVLDPIQRGVNSSDQWFARGALRWQPTDTIDIQLGYLHQHTSMADAQWANPTWPGGIFDPSTGFWPNAKFDSRPGCDYCTTNFVAEPFSDKIDLLSLDVSADLGFATITSASSYYDHNILATDDQTGFQYNLAEPGVSFINFYPYSNFPRELAELNSASSDRSTIEELRLVSNPGKRLDYVIGLFYQSQKDGDNTAATLPGMQAYLDQTKQPEPSPYGDTTYLYNRATDFEDRAIFGELTFHVTSAWQVTGGARFFHQTFNSDVELLFPLCGAICAADQTNRLGLNLNSSESRISNHIKKLNTSYDLSPTTKVYATYSEGFRRGGVSGLPTGGPYADPIALQTFAPDLAKNYELGIKGTLLDRRLQYFADIFLINLDNFQFNGFSLSGVPGAFNGKEARSKGFEGEMQAALTDRLNAALGYAYTDAYVSQSFDVLDYPPYALIPAFGGNGKTASLFGGPLPAGTRLPGVAKNTFTVSGDYTLPAVPIGSRNWTWRLHADGVYRSSEQAALGSTSFYNWTIPSSFVTNARLTAAPTDKTSFYLFINNITSDPAYSGSENVQKIPNIYALRNVSPPRTVGLGVSCRF
jgi:outer membrane receptor protein involved in Fe transport